MGVTHSLFSYVHLFSYFKEKYYHPSSYCKVLQGSLSSIRIFYGEKLKPHHHNNNIVTYVQTLVNIIQTRGTISRYLETSIIFPSSLRKFNELYTVLSLKIWKFLLLCIQDMAFMGRMLGVHEYWGRDIYNARRRWRPEARWVDQELWRIWM